MATSTSPPPAPAIDSPPAQTHLPHLPHPSDSGGPLDDYNMNSKIIISALCILFLIVLTIVILHVYAKWCSSRRAHVQQRMVAYLRSTGSLSVAPSESAKSCGLEKEIVNGLPTFAYLPPVSKRTADSLGAASVAKTAECAVCLAEFRQGEACKMLPKCKHFFHVRCIDIWFLSNTTCPLCRATPGLSIVDEEAAEHSTGGDCDELCQGSQRGLVLGQDMEMGMAKDGQDDHNLLNSGFSSQSRRWKRSLSDKILGAVSAKELVIPSNHAQMRPRPPLVWGRSASYSTIDSLRDVESQVEFSTRSCRSGLVSPRAASRPLDDP